MAFKRSGLDPAQQQVVTKNILSITRQIYDKVKEERPDEDEHFYLATTWYRKHFEDKRPYRQGDPLLEGELDRLSWTETMQFAILDPPDSIRVLSLYMVYKECPREYLKYVQEYNELMEPVTTALEDDTFMEVYREKNPRIVMRSEPEG